MTAPGQVPQTGRPVVRVAVTGASGCIGRALITRLSQTEDTVVSALYRTPLQCALAATVDRCEAVLGDLDDRSALAELVRDADVVYHCAATMEKASPERSWRINVAGTGNVARAALEAGVHRLVYVSSISVFAATRSPDFTITEATEPANVERLNHYSRSKLAGEHLLRTIAPTGLACTILRPTNVYGPWSNPWFLQWTETLRRTRYIPGNVPIDIVHVDDVAAAMIQAAQSPLAWNDTFHIGHERILLSDFVGRIAGVVQRPLHRLPPWLDQRLRHGIETGYRLATGRVMSLSLTRPVLYPHAKATRAFGYAPAIHVDEGFASLTEWYSGQIW